MVRIESQSHVVDVGNQLVKFNCGSSKYCMNKGEFEKIAEEFCKINNYTKKYKSDFSVGLKEGYSFKDVGDNCICITNNNHCERDSIILKKKTVIDIANILINSGYLSKNYE